MPRPEMPNALIWPAAVAAEQVRRPIIGDGGPNNARPNPERMRHGEKVVQKKNNISRQKYLEAVAIFNENKKRRRWSREKIGSKQRGVEVQHKQRRNKKKKVQREIKSVTELLVKKEEARKQKWEKYGALKVVPEKKQAVPSGTNKMDGHSVIGRNDEYKCK